MSSSYNFVRRKERNVSRFDGSTFLFFVIILEKQRYEIVFEIYEEEL